MTRVRCSCAYLNVYKVFQQYGGPEEGGWWYPVYEPVASVPHSLFYGRLVLEFEPQSESEPDMRDPFRGNGFLDRPELDENDLPLTPEFVAELEAHEQAMWESLREYGEESDSLVFRWETGFARVMPTRRPHYE